MTRLVDLIEDALRQWVAETLQINESTGTVSAPARGTYLDEARAVMSFGPCGPGETRAYSTFAPAPEPEAQPIDEPLTEWQRVGLREQLHDVFHKPEDAFYQWYRSLKEADRAYVDATLQSWVNTIYDVAEVQAD